ncbi:MAG: MFS transporter [Candidatus Eisenbacteria bacterium]|uniref:MFS transporter n=1 Tax=Eiseniibacteriota bacterium TaxID=2212470 RepID=A0A948W5U6_UNCEI|nr:MFS transporter [Candidatus Eisenbacteria bacterium]
MSFASLYFKSQGLPIFKIIIVWAISPAVAMLVVSLVRSYSIRTFLCIGILLYAMKALTLFFYFKYSYLLYGMLAGLVLGIFWVALNYIFFSRSPSANHAKNSSVYFIIPSLLGIILPPVGALIIGYTNFKVLFALVVLLSPISLGYVLKKIPAQIAVFNFRDSHRRFKGLKLITGFEGALHFFQSVFIPVYILLFLTSEFEVGGFHSYTAFIGFIVTVILAKYSDKQQKRLVVIAPLLIAMGVVILLLGAIHQVWWWLMLIGVYSFLDNITLPIRFAIPMDFKGKDIGFWAMSEFYGNFGRTVLLALSAVFFYFNAYWLAFIIFALIALFYPSVINYQIKRNLHKPLLTS